MPVSNPIAVNGILTCNIEALCCVLPSTHGFVQNGRPMLALVVFTCNLDHDGATCKAVKMCSTDVKEFPERTGARLLPVMHRLSMNLRVSSGGVAANVLLASAGVNSLALLVSCATSRARMTGFAASPLVVQTQRVPMGFQPRLVQASQVNLQFTHEHQLLLTASAQFWDQATTHWLRHMRLVRIHVHSSARSTALPQSVQLPRCQRLR